MCSPAAGIMLRFDFYKECLIWSYLQRFNYLLIDSKSMNIDAFVNDFSIQFLADRLKKDELLRAHTTWRVGGPADLFFESHSTDELVGIISLCRTHNVPFFYSWWWF